MTDIKARLDEIALKYARRAMNPADCEEWPEFVQNFRDALDKALEVVVPLAVERCAERGVWDKRVITAALLEELKK